MSRIASAFEKGPAFIAFVTGGDPSLEATERFVLALVEAGAGLVEIGVPFSDPIAEGPVIQEANLRALAAGTTLDRLLRLVERLRAKTQTPLVFLTYLNPVFRAGYDRFFPMAAAAGLDGVIIPDLPFEEQGELLPAATAAGVDVISLVAPTSEERIAKIAPAARGFLYLVSSLGVTGVRGALGANLGAMAKKARELSPVPVAVGFGIHTPEQAREVAGLADGVIVGSALVEIIARHGEAAAPFLADYTRRMRQAISGR